MQQPSLPCCPHYAALTTVLVLLRSSLCCPHCAAHCAGLTRLYAATRPSLNVPSASQQLPRSPSTCTQHLHTALAPVVRPATSFNLGARRWAQQADGPSSQYEPSAYAAQQDAEQQWLRGPEQWQHEPSRATVGWLGCVSGGSAVLQAGLCHQPHASHQAQVSQFGAGDYQHAPAGSASQRSTPRQRNQLMPMHRKGGGTGGTTPRSTPRRQEGSTTGVCTQRCVRAEY